MRLTALSSTGRWGTKMNSFETDMKRACVSVNFMAGLLLEWLILAFAGPDSELFQISIPVLAALPYSSAWLMDYQSGFIRQYLPRCGKASYILGKFLSCGISGGALPATACFVWEQLGARGEGEVVIKIPLVFLSGMLWAVVAATLAAASNSRYVAYGGSFVLFYMLVILYERYFPALYCLYPIEWFAPGHTWVFGDTGIIAMVVGLILVTGVLYGNILRRCIERA